MNLLSPEQLAEYQRKRALAEAGYGEDLFGQDPVRALLDHIEAREQQVKAELQGLLTRKDILAVLEGEDLGRSQNRDKHVHEAAARLGISLD